MADQNQQTGTVQSAGVATNGGVVVDASKSAEQYILEAEGQYVIPHIVREKFQDLVKLIYETESMNEEEREYWLQIMPIMTEEQITKFRNILVNEKVQLQKLDQEYEQEMSKINKKQNAVIDEEKLKEKMTEIKEKEQKADVAEKAEEAELLKKLEGM